MQSFERRVPRDVWSFVWSMGYQSVPDDRKRAWLEEHFFLPGGWPECRDIARVESVTRVRKYCWRAVVDVVVVDVPTYQGRPRTKSMRQTALYHLLHREEPIYTEWQWPLIRLAIEDGKLSDAERLWLLGRAGVLPEIHARLFGLELAVFAGEQSGLHRGLIDEGCEIIRAHYASGAKSPMAVRKRLTRQLPKHPATLAFLEVMGMPPAVALRKTLGQAARACSGLKPKQLQAAFSAMIRPVVMERAL